MKCSHTSHVEVDQFLILNMHDLVETWAARGRVFEIPRLTVKCTLSLTK